MPESVQLITLGCPKNEVDSEVAARIFTTAGYTVSPEAANPGIVFINTCGFIEDAKKEGFDEIEKVLEKKRQGLVGSVYVAGCLVQRSRRELEEWFPGVDAFFGVTDFSGIAKQLGITDDLGISLPRHRLTPPHYAYLKIAEGCDYDCSFCAIPSIRGRQKSRTPESLCDEARILVEQGARELIVIAEDTTQYGKDLRNGVRLPGLMRKLDAIDGLLWIRLMYAYPGSVSDELINVIANSEKICHYIDVPIQHVNDRILKRMKRAYRRTHIESTIERLRENIPDIALRTTVIAGFPGETDREFVELSDFLSEVEFDRLGVFEYSDEPGTGAYELDDKNDRRVIAERYEELLLNHDEIAEKKNREKIGTEVDVLVDLAGSGGAAGKGRTQADAPDIDMSVRLERPAEPGTIINSRVVDATAFELTCT